MKLAKAFEILPNNTWEEPIYIPTKSEISGQRWEKYYKKPSASMKINWAHMRALWYWIAERLNIWHKRTILKQPYPWTEDTILQENKFTNCIRDLDKGSIIYIREILSRMDDYKVDHVKRAKEVILNTQIYRLFLKLSTWRMINFLPLDDFPRYWEIVKDRLRKARLDNEIIFHSAYMVPNMRTANDDEITKSNKLENAICVCDSFYKYIDDTYEYITTHSMEKCMSYLQHFKGVGDFNIYEWLCDWGGAYRHIQHPFVSWTDDDYVNSGPGNKVGLRLIFEDPGDLNLIQLNIYLRATWRHYMKRYGVYEHFMELLPQWLNNDINLRVIEHSLCELQKYLAEYYGTGKCKSKFSNESKDNLDYLVI